MAEAGRPWQAGLALVLVTPGDRDPEATETLVARALEGGVTALLLRERQLAEGPRAGLYQRLVTRCRAQGALALVSREASLARELGAHGVHCGHGGPDVASARAAAPDLVVSRSAHWPLGEDDALADWVTLSPCFPTPASHPRPLLEVSQLEQALADPALGPVVALGGVTLEGLPDLPPGLAGVAVMRAITEAGDPVAAARRLRRAVDRRRAADHDGTLGIH